MSISIFRLVVLAAFILSNMSKISASSRDSLSGLSSSESEISTFARSEKYSLLTIGNPVNETFYVSYRGYGDFQGGNHTYAGYYFLKPGNNFEFENGQHYRLRLQQEGNVAFPIACYEKPFSDFPRHSHPKISSIDFAIYQTTEIDGRISLTSDTPIIQLNACKPVSVFSIGYANAGELVLYPVDITALKWGFVENFECAGYQKEPLRAHQLNTRLDTRRTRPGNSSLMVEMLNPNPSAQNTEKMLRDTIMGLHKGSIGDMEVANILFNQEISIDHIKKFFRHSSYTPIIENAVEKHIQFLYNGTCLVEVRLARKMSL